MNYADVVAERCGVLPLREQLLSGVKTMDKLKEVNKMLSPLNVTINDLAGINRMNSKSAHQLMTVAPLRYKPFLVSALRNRFDDISDFMSEMTDISPPLSAVVEAREEGVRRNTLLSLYESGAINFEDLIAEIRRGEERARRSNIMTGEEYRERQQEQQEIVEEEVAPQQ